MPVRGYYTSNVDLQELAVRDSTWKAFFTSRNDDFVDWSDCDLNEQLTKALLRTDFGVQHLSLPHDRLCPPVPVRWNYVRWIQCLLDTTSGIYHQEGYDPEREIFGLDIGTGASAIYPLLACSSRPNWSILATDIDAKSLDCANINIVSNILGSQVQTRLVDANADHVPIPTDAAPDSHLFDFVMCNPPFYSSCEDIQSSANLKEHPPATTCLGSEREMITEGGEVKFISSLIEQSCILKRRVQWYTTMLGKLSSVQSIILQLQDKEIDNYTVARLLPHAKTQRWAVAWSFDPLRPAQTIISQSAPKGPRGLPSLVGRSRPFSTEIFIPAYASQPEIREGAVLEVLRAVKAMAPSFIYQHDLGDTTVIYGCAKQVFWNRAFRRQLKRKAHWLEATGLEPGAAPTDGHDGPVHETEVSRGDDLQVAEPIDASLRRPPSNHQRDPVALGFALTASSKGLYLRWIEGAERAVFLSFQGMLERKLKESIAAIKNAAQQRDLSLPTNSND